MDEKSTCTQKNWFGTDRFAPSHIVIVETNVTDPFVRLSCRSELSLYTEQGSCGIRCQETLRAFNLLIVIRWIFSAFLVNFNFSFRPVFQLKCFNLLLHSIPQTWILKALWENLTPFPPGISRDLPLRGNYGYFLVLYNLHTFHVVVKFSCRI